MLAIHIEHQNKMQPRVRISENEDGTVKADIINDTLPVSPLSAEEKARIWYTRDEIAAIKHEIRETVRGVRQSHELDPFNFKSFTNSHLHVFSQCIDCETGPRHHDMLRLIHWIKSCPSTRGLERRSFPIIEKERKKQGRNHVRTILHIYNTNAHLDQKLLVDKVARKSEAMSRSARLFAMCMGICDAVAVREVAAIRRFSPVEDSTPVQSVARGA